MLHPTGDDRRDADPTDYELERKYQAADDIASKVAEALEGDGVTDHDIYCEYDPAEDQFVMGGSVSFISQPFRDASECPTFMSIDMQAAAFRVYDAGE